MVARFDLEVCGGTFVDEPCVADGNLVSGRTFHDNGLYFGAFMTVLTALAPREQRAFDHEAQRRPLLACE
jgi:hypothetical protein